MDDHDSSRSAAVDSADLYRAFHDKIYHHILHLVSDPAEAQDLTQETFVRVHERLGSLKDQAAVGTWLYRIATHLCYDRFRSASYRNKPVSLDGSPEGEDPTVDTVQAHDEDLPRIDEAMERTEMSGCVRDYLDRLSDSYRAVILLHDVEGMTNPEIAEMLGCSLDTVKIRLHRARKKLKAALDAGCDFEQDRRGVTVCEPKSPEQED